MPLNIDPSKMPGHPIPLTGNRLYSIIREQMTHELEEPNFELWISTGSSFVNGPFRKVEASEDAVHANVDPLSLPQCQIWVVLICDACNLRIDSEKNPAVQCQVCRVSLHAECFRRSHINEQFKFLQKHAKRDLVFNTPSILEYLAQFDCFGCQLQIFGCLCPDSDCTLEISLETNFLRKIGDRSAYLDIAKQKLADMVSYMSDLNRRAIERELLIYGHGIDPVLHLSEHKRRFCPRISISDARQIQFFFKQDENNKFVYKSHLVTIFRISIAYDKECCKICSFTHFFPIRAHPIERLGLVENKNLLKEGVETIFDDLFSSLKPKITFFHAKVVHDAENVIGNFFRLQENSFRDCWPPLKDDAEKMKESFRLNQKEGKLKLSVRPLANSESVELRPEVILSTICGSGCITIGTVIRIEPQDILKNTWHICLLLDPGVSLDQSVISSAKSFVQDKFVCVVESELMGQKSFFFGREKRVMKFLMQNMKESQLGNDEAQVAANYAPLFQAFYLNFDSFLRDRLCRDGTGDSLVTSIRKRVESLDDASVDVTEAEFKQVIECFLFPLPFFERHGAQLSVDDIEELDVSVGKWPKSLQKLYCILTDQSHETKAKIFLFHFERNLPLLSAVRRNFSRLLFSTWSLEHCKRNRPNFATFAESLFGDESTFPLIQQFMNESFEPKNTILTRYLWLYWFDAANQPNIPENVYKELVKMYLFLGLPYEPSVQDVCLTTLKRHCRHIDDYKHKQLEATASTRPRSVSSDSFDASANSSELSFVDITTIKCFLDAKIETIHIVESLGFFLHGDVPQDVLDSLELAHELFGKDIQLVENPFENFENLLKKRCEVLREMKTLLKATATSGNGTKTHKNAKDPLTPDQENKLIDAGCQDSVSFLQKYQAFKQQHDFERIISFNGRVYERSFEESFAVSFKTFIEKSGSKVSSKNINVISWLKSSASCIETFKTFKPAEVDPELKVVIVLHSIDHLNLCCLIEDILLNSDGDKYVHIPNEFFAMASEFSPISDVCSSSMLNLTPVHIECRDDDIKISFSCDDRVVVTLSCHPDCKISHRHHCPIIFSEEKCRSYQAFFMSYNPENQDYKLFQDFLFFSQDLSILVSNGRHSEKASESLAILERLESQSEFCVFDSFLHFRDQTAKLDQEETKYSAHFRDPALSHRLWAPLEIDDFSQEIHDLRSSEPQFKFKKHHIHSVSKVVFRVPSLQLISVNVISCFDGKKQKYQYPKYKDLSPSEMAVMMMPLSEKKKIVDQHPLLAPNLQKEDTSTVVTLFLEIPKCKSFAYVVELKYSDESFKDFAKLYIDVEPGNSDTFFCLSNLNVNSFFVCPPRMRREPHSSGIDALNSSYHGYFHLNSDLSNFLDDCDIGVAFFKLERDFQEYKLASRHGFAPVRSELDFALFLDSQLDASQKIDRRLASQKARLQDQITQKNKLVSTHGVMQESVHRDFVELLGRLAVQALKFRMNPEICPTFIEENQVRQMLPFTIFRCQVVSLVDKPDPIKFFYSADADGWQSLKSGDCLRMCSFNASLLSADYYTFHSYDNGEVSLIKNVGFYFYCSYEESKYFKSPEPPEFIKFRVQTESLRFVVSHPIYKFFLQLCGVSNRLCPIRRYRPPPAIQHLLDLEYNWAWANKKPNGLAGPELTDQGIGCFNEDELSRTAVLVLCAQRYYKEFVEPMSPRVFTWFPSSLEALKNFEFKRRDFRFFIDALRCTAKGYPYLALTLGSSSSRLELDLRKFRNRQQQQIEELLCKNPDDSSLQRCLAEVKNRLSYLDEESNRTMLMLGEKWKFHSRAFVLLLDSFYRQMCVHSSHLAASEINIISITQHQAYKLCKTLSRVCRYYIELLLSSDRSSRDSSSAPNWRVLPICDDIWQVNFEAFQKKPISLPTADDERTLWLKACLILEACTKGVKPFVATVMRQTHQQILDNVRQGIMRDLLTCENEEWDCSTCSDADDAKFTENAPVALTIRTMDSNGISDCGVPHELKAHALKPCRLSSIPALCFSDCDGLSPTLPLLICPNPADVSNSKSSTFLLLHCSQPMPTQPQLTPFVVTRCEPSEPALQFHAVLCNSRPGHTAQLVKSFLSQQPPPFIHTNARGESPDLSFAFWSLQSDDQVFKEFKHGVKSGHILRFEGGEENPLPPEMKSGSRYLVTIATDFSFNVCGPILTPILPLTAESYPADDAPLVIRRSPIAR